MDFIKSVMNHMEKLEVIFQLSTNVQEMENSKVTFQINIYKCSKSLKKKVFKLVYHSWNFQLDNIYTCMYVPENKGNLIYDFCGQRLHS